jgi:Uma2 family endonuclease
MTVAILLKQFTVSDYARMRETGILAEDDRVELIAGEVRQMSPIGPFHAAIVKRLNAVLSRLIDETVIVSVQDPIQLDDQSEPQPDLALLQYRDDYYAHAHPVADDVLLVIEVADSSADYDREEKMPRYAAANIPEAWLIDLSIDRIEQYSQPRNGIYRLKQIIERGEELQSHAIPAIHIATNQFFE